MNETSNAIEVPYASMRSALFVEYRAGVRRGGGSSVQRKRRPTRQRLTQPTLVLALGLLLTAAGGCKDGCEQIEITEVHAEADYMLVARVFSDGEPVVGRTVRFRSGEAL